MKHFRSGILATLLLLCTFSLRAQSLFLWEDNLEELAEETGTTDWEDELEELSYRLQEPINLNSATREQLEQFPFLTARQVEEIQAYVYIHGPHHRAPAAFRLREARGGGEEWLSFAEGPSKVRKARGFGSL